MTWAATSPMRWSRPRRSPSPQRPDRAAAERLRPVLSPSGLRGSLRSRRVVGARTPQSLRDPGLARQEMGRGQSTFPRSADLAQRLAHGDDEADGHEDKAGHVLGADLHHRAKPPPDLKSQQAKAHAHRGEYHNRLDQRRVPDAQAEPDD